MPVFGRLDLNESTNFRWWYFAFLCKPTQNEDWRKGFGDDCIRQTQQDSKQPVAQLGSGNRAAPITNPIGKPSDTTGLQPVEFQFLPKPLTPNVVYNPISLVPFERLPTSTAINRARSCIEAPGRS
jgi:hypothetical protein